MRCNFWQLDFPPQGPWKQRKSPLQREREDWPWSLERRDKICKSCFKHVWISCFSNSLGLAIFLFLGLMNDLKYPYNKYILFLKSVWVRSLSLATKTQIITIYKTGSKLLFNYAFQLLFWYMTYFLQIFQLGNYKLNSGNKLVKNQGPWKTTIPTPHV